MHERVAIYIDGGNFYHLALKQLGIYEPDFDFDGFAHLLADGRPLADLGKRYYIGTVRERAGNSRSVDAMSRQGKTFSALISSGWQVKTSKLRQRNEKLVIDARVNECARLRSLGISEVTYTRDREKGIDVKIVTDLFIGAIDDKYDTAIIVSSDTDLVPAIDSIRNRFGKKVEYIGFSLENAQSKTKPLLSMISRTDRQRTFVESDLAKFVKKEKESAVQAGSL